MPNDLKWASQALVSLLPDIIALDQCGLDVCPVSIARGGVVTTNQK